MSGSNSKYENHGAILQTMEHIEQNTKPYFYKIAVNNKPNNNPHTK